MVLIEFLKGFALTIAIVIAAVLGVVIYGYCSVSLLSYTDFSNPVKAMITILGLIGIIGGIAYAADSKG